MTETATLGEITREASQKISQVSDSARLDAELLVAHVLGITRSRFISDPEQALTSQQVKAINTLIQRRAQGEPVAYLLEHKHFWDLELRVTPAVLIPRPDTELLVETALILFTQESEFSVLDLGTGSGAIAIAIARSRPHWHVTATDDSQPALAVAIENAETYQLHNLTLLKSHWFEKLGTDKLYDLIVSNPPYIRDNDPHLQLGDVRFEPRSALVSGADGLNAIRYLISESKQHLQQGGWLMLEHGYDQGDNVKQLFVENGYQDVQQKMDLGGHIRATMGRW